MPALRIDWEGIRDRFAPDEPVLFCLPRRYQQLLLSYVDVLTWEATYRDRGWDFSDWDDLQDVVEAGTVGLLGGTPLSEIIQYIDEVESLLTEIRDRPCCTDETFIYDQTQDPGGVIQNEQDDTGSDVVVYDGDPPNEVPDWPTYEGLLCDAATKFADGLPGLLEMLATVSSLTNIGLALAVTFLLAAFAGIGLVGAAVAGTLSTVLSLSFLDNLRSLLGQDDPFATEIAELEDATFRQRVICDIVSNTSAADAYTDFVATLTALAPNAKPYVLWFPIQFALNKIYNAESDAAGGFGGGCGACFDFDLTFTFDTDIEGWSPVRQSPWDAENGGSVKVYGHTNDGILRYLGQDLETDTSLVMPITMQLRHFSFDFSMVSSGNAGEARVYVNDDVAALSTTFDRATYDNQGWMHHTFDLTGHTELTLNDLSWMVQFVADRASTTQGTEFRFFIDNVRLKGVVL